MQIKRTTTASVVEAVYAEQRIPHYVGNPLIGALPVSLDEDDLFKTLLRNPDFKAEQRQWKTHERLQMLLGLTHFMVPFEAHIGLARVLDAMMRDGYVGRAPFSKEHNEIIQRTYARRQAGEGLQVEPSDPTPQHSASLIGLSGMGKTTTVKRFLKTVPNVIHHRELGIYQVPWLHIEMTSDGKSVKALMAAILKALDRLFPDSDFYKTHFAGGKPGVSTLLMSVSLLMSKLHVGLLVVDEVQNLANSPKAKETVMSELVSMTNDLEVPILFIGTNKAAKVLGLDLRQARRAGAPGIGTWGAMPRTSEDGQPGEWVDFMNVMWKFQWVKKPCELTDALLDQFYECTQGVIDLAIKLFVAAQARAMIDESEELTEALITKVFASDLKFVHPMVKALQDGDLESLAKFEDIAPFGLDDLVNEMGRRYKAKRTFIYSTRPGNEDFTPRLAVAGIALGLDPEQAQDVAEAVEREGKARNMLEAAKQMADKLSTPRKVATPKAAVGLAPRDYTDRPQDYRRAVALAHEHGTTVFEQLQSLGFARPVLELVAV
jgi:hypothetical protein